MYCEKCGKKLNEGDIYCGNCGFKIPIENLFYDNPKELHGDDKENENTRIMSYDINDLLEKAKISLADGDWRRTYQLCEMALNLCPDYSEIYFIKYLAKNQSKNADTLKEILPKFIGDSDFDKALKYADAEFKKQLEGYNEYAINNTLYNQTIKAFNQASSDKSCDDCIREFQRLSGFKDADGFIKRCEEKREEIHIKAANRKKIYVKLLIGLASVVIAFLIHYGMTSLHQMKINQLHEKILEVKSAPKIAMYLKQQDDELIRKAALNFPKLNNEQPTSFKIEGIIDSIKDTTRENAYGRFPCKEITFLTEEYIFDDYSDSTSKFYGMDFKVKTKAYFYTEIMSGDAKEELDKLKPGNKIELIGQRSVTDNFTRSTGTGNLAGTLRDDYIHFMITSVYDYCTLLTSNYIILESIDEPKYKAIDFAALENPSLQQLKIIPMKNVSSSEPKDIATISTSDSSVKDSKQLSSLYGDAKYLIYIHKLRYRLDLYEKSSNNLIYSFPIAVGKNSGDKGKAGDNRTPTSWGSAVTIPKKYTNAAVGIQSAKVPFRVEKIIDSSKWSHDFRDGKGVIENAYGPWFISLDTGWEGIGIHGTHDTYYLGEKVTEGSIWMHNKDLLVLKQTIVKDNNGVGTAVIITED